MERAMAAVLLGILIALSFNARAVPVNGTALLHARMAQRTTRTRTLPAPVSFREDKNRGLLVTAWINGRGPFNAAIDTGAGITIVSEHLSRAAGLQETKGRSMVLAGLSGREVTAKYARLEQIAIGDPGNMLPASVQAAVAPTLPAGVDLVLDPTDSYGIFGYTIDFPNHTIQAFDPGRDAVRPNRPPSGGAVVLWLRDGQSDRPFVRLGDGRLALIDTGSNLGLAMSQAAAKRGERQETARDLGGGVFGSTRVGRSNVSIGALALNGVPTDILTGVEDESLVLLGRGALYPFRIRFDPLHRLIEIAPAMQDRN
jgi:hypothetical protein